MQGGVGDYTCELCKALAAEGVEVHVLTSRPEGTNGLGRGTECVASGGGCAVHRAAEDWGWRSWRRIDQLQAEVGADILHVQYQAAAYGMHPAINLLPLRWRLQGSRRPRLVTTFHDLLVPYLFPKAGRLRWDVVLGLARWSDAVVVTNAADRERLAEHSVDAALIPIGSNISPRLPAGFERDRQRAEWGVGRDAFLICHFGFMNARKGVDTLLRAVHLLQADSASNLRPHVLMIGGKVGSSDPTNVEYLNEMEALVEQLELGKNVTWTGFLPPELVSACFAAADCCVLPYRDGASFRHGTLMAALAHGMAIVTTFPSDVPGCQAAPDLREGEEVLLVPPEEPQTLAAAIVRLATAPELLEKLGRSAKRLSERFAWATIAKQHLEVYSGLA
jgi:glycosyltransferase involved in cell wall biosynthesis